jgi:hypothetical protein
LSTDDRPLELILQLGRQEAHQDVSAAAGRERADEGHGSARIIVGLRAGGAAGNQGQSEGESERSDPHGIPVPWQGVVCRYRFRACYGLAEQMPRSWRAATFAG